MITVNDIRISEQDILQEVQYHSANDHHEAMLKATESLIISQLVKQRAMNLGIADAKDVIDNERIDQLLEQEVAMPEALEEECLTYYENNPNKFYTSPLISASHILLPASADDAEKRDAARNQATALIQDLKQGADFAILAAQFSRCQSANEGGSLGQISKGQTVDEFEQQLFRMPEGLGEYPIESRYGLHVVHIDQRAEGMLLPFEQVKDKISEYLNEKVKRKATAQYIQQLIDNAEITGFKFDVNSSPLMQ